MIHLFQNLDQPEIFFNRRFRVKTISWKIKTEMAPLHYIYQDKRSLYRELFKKADTINRETSFESIA